MGAQYLVGGGTHGRLRDQTCSRALDQPATHHAVTAIETEHQSLAIQGLVVPDHAPTLGQCKESHVLHEPSAHHRISPVQAPPQRLAIEERFVGCALPVPIDQLGLRDVDPARRRRAERHVQALLHTEEQRSDQCKVKPGPTRRDQGVYQIGEDHARS